MSCRTVQWMGLEDTGGFCRTRWDWEEKNSYAPYRGWGSFVAFTHGLRRGLFSDAPAGAWSRNLDASDCAEGEPRTPVRGSVVVDGMVAAGRVVQLRQVVMPTCS